MDNVLVGLGSNLGNKLNNIKNTIHLINKFPNTKVELQSQIIESKSIGFDSYNFFNCVILVQTTLNPFEFQQYTKQIEFYNGKQFRERTEEYKDRIIDIDLLIWEKTIINTRFLQLPHPELFKRKFVLHSINELTKHNEFIKNYANWDFFYNLCDGNEFFVAIS
mgnify:FL=1|jgi:2-amino-4-hydroxy-6-hydroxymethyldihydropteridine diphosphokinase